MKPEAEDIWNDLLVPGAARLGVTLSAEQMEKLQIYLQELKKWNARINLTAITKDRDIVIGHFLDSLACVKFLKMAGGASGEISILDIGTGAGFPGLPIKIVLPEARVVLMDSVGKKVSFLKHVIRTLGLKGVEACCGRAEDPSLIDKYGEKFDYVISRALTEMEGLLELSRPYLKDGGRVVAMKGPATGKLAHELEGLPQDLPHESHEVAIPFANRTTSIIIAR